MWLDGGGTLEARLLGEEERRVFPANGVLGIAPAGLHHFVESRYSIAWLEFADV